MNSALAFLEDNRERLHLDQYGIPARLTSLVLTPRFHASRHVVFLILPAGKSYPALVVKMPRLVETDSSLEREAGALRAIQALRPAGFDSIPRLVAFEQYGQRLILVETALVGTLMSPAVVRRDLAGCCNAVIDWLGNVHQASLSAGNADWFGQMVEKPLHFFADMFPLSTEEQALMKQTEELVAPLRDAKLPFVCEHGDLSHPNLIRRREGGLGVVDWELAETRGLIAYDLFFFLTYAAFSLHEAPSKATHVAAFHAAFFERSAWALPYVQAYARRLNLPLSTLTPLFVLCWARYTITLLMRLAASRSQAPIEAHTAAWLRANRYYALWRHAAANAHRLAWGN